MILEEEFHLHLDTIKTMATRILLLHLQVLGSMGNLHQHMLGVTSLHHMEHNSGSSDLVEARNKTANQSAAAFPVRGVGGDFVNVRAFGLSRSLRVASYPAAASSPASPSAAAFHNPQRRTCSAPLTLHLPHPGQWSSAPPHSLPPPSFGDVPNAANR
nr:unnamed protein product [Digitaria exilis]